MLISRTPFRISFVGGGSDLESYYKHKGGSVLSTSIDKFIYQSSHKYFYKNKCLIKYSKTENIDDIEKINHPIIKNIFKRFGINNVDYNSIADIPSGTGMGSSSSFTVGLIKLYSEYKNINMTKREIAELACAVEIDDLKEPIGKQDQYAAAFGGINEIVFNKDNTVVVNPININYEDMQLLENNFKLFYTGITRSASSVLKHQKNEMDSNRKLDVIDSMVELVPILKNESEKGKIDEMGRILNEGWNLKKQISNKISNPSIDNLYDYGLSCGASGGKLLGAGAGGFILFYVPIDKSIEFNRKFNGYDSLDFKFDFTGTKIIFNDEKRN